MKHPHKPAADAPYRDRPLSDLPQTLALTYYAGGGEEAALAMDRWVETLAEEGGGKLVFERPEVEGQPFLPSLCLRTGAASAFHYHFVPEGPETAVFREFLWEAAAQRVPARAGSAQAEPAGPPHEMLLFVSTHCPNCPHAVRTVQALTRKLPNLSAHLFEAMLSTDLAERNDIRSVPTLLVDQDLRYVGGLDEEKLLAILRAREPESLLHEKLRKQIQEGGAEETAEWIAGGGDPSFLASDLGKSTFQERIALLLTLEEALARDPRCLDRIVGPLLPHLETGDASVRGDIADLLGKIGDRKALPALKKLCRDPDPNVVEAATEAVESIEEPEP
jgi:glutaredoxin